MHGRPGGREVDLGVAADEAVGLELRQQRARRVGVEVRRALEVAAERLAGKPGAAGGDQLEGVPGLRLGVAPARCSRSVAVSVRSANARAWPNWP